MPVRDKSYREHLKEELGALIDALDLPELNKEFLKKRWLDQLVWMEGAAESAHSRYTGLRMVMIVGGILIPALLSLNLSARNTAPPGFDLLPAIVSWSAFGLGLVVAISAATEEFFKFGDRWRHYRRLAETLKTEGWQFFQRSGAYRRYPTHVDAYPNFAGRIEALFRNEVEIYITEVAGDKEADANRTDENVRAHEANSPINALGKPIREVPRAPVEK